MGSAAGLILAATGLVERWSRPAGFLPESVIARVGDHLIPETRYQELLSDLQADKRTPLTSQDKQFVLDRLIDEELLILRGIELGLPETSPAIRKSIAAAVISQIAAENDARIPDEDTLRRFYEANADFFSTTARYRLRWWNMPGSGAESAEAAAAALEALRTGTAEETVLRSTGLKAHPFLPDQMLPLTKLADYLGADLAWQIPKLEAGEFSQPIAMDGDLNILLLEERLEGETPAFERIRPVIEVEYLRRLGDEALRDYLAWLRERTEVTVATGAMD